MDTADPNFDPEAYLANQRLLDAQKKPPAASQLGGKGPVGAAATVVPQVAPPPFVPEQTPAMLPMQQGLQMPAGKGSGKGPSQMQIPQQMQVGPGNLNGAGMMPQGSNRPMDLQALIQGLLSSGLLGGL